MPSNLAFASCYVQEAVGCTTGSLPLRSALRFVLEMRFGVGLAADFVAGFAVADRCGRLVEAAAMIERLWPTFSVLPTLLRLDCFRVAFLRVGAW